MQEKRPEHEVVAEWNQFLVSQATRDMIRWGGVALIAAIVAVVLGAFGFVLMAIIAIGVASVLGVLAADAHSQRRFLRRYPWKTLIPRIRESGDLPEPAQDAGRQGHE